MLQFETWYHIYNHGNGDDNLFREDENYDFFLRKYHHHIDPIADTKAWCLMPNHFHLLVKIKSEAEIVDYFSNLPDPPSSFLSSNFSSNRNFSKVSNFRKVDDRKVDDDPEGSKSKFLSKQFSNFFSAYSQAFNKVYQRRGSLFLKNFKRKEIENDFYLKNIILYIHLNPIKHGFTRQIDDWPWHSYDTFIKEEPELIQNLFSGIAGYKEAHQDKLLYFREYEQLENDLN